MYSQIAVILFLGLSVVAITLWFLREKRLMVLSHSSTISKLEIGILTNREQINRRNHCLNKYDLLKYNLQDALVIQNEIEL